MSTITSSTSQSGQEIELRRLLWVVPLAIIASSIANLILHAVALALFPTVGDFELLHTGSITVSTAVFLLIGAAVFIVTTRLSSRPVFHYRRIAVVALILSLAMPIAAGAGMSPGSTPDAVTVVVLILMHVAAAAISVPMYTNLTRAS